MFVYFSVCFLLQRLADATKTLGTNYIDKLIIMKLILYQYFIKEQQNH